MHSTTYVTQTPSPHRTLDELGRCGLDHCAVSMAPGPARSEVRTELRPQLHALACNLATFLRSSEPPEALEDGSLTSLRLKLIQISPRVVRHARAITFQRAEVSANVGKLLVDSLGNSPIHNRCYGGGNRSTRPVGAPSNPCHQPSAEVQQLEEIQ